MIKGLNAKTKALLTMGALILIFLGPLIGAWSFYNSRVSFLPPTNFGQLVVPPLPFYKLNLSDTDKRPFPVQILQRKWLMVYYAPKACDKLCAQNLYAMRQVRLALGKDMDRVQRMLLTSPEPVADPALDKSLIEDYLGTYHATVFPGELETFLPKALYKQTVSNGGGLFLVDPLGNMILYYPPDENPEKILKDLTKLLRVSQIG